MNQYVDQIAGAAQDQANGSLTDAVVDRAGSLLSRISGRGVAFTAARFGMRAIPVVGLGLLAYDLGDTASRLITGKGLIENANEKIFGKAEPEHEQGKEAQASVTSQTSGAPGSRATLLQEAMAIAATDVPAHPGHTNARREMEIG